MPASRSPQPPLAPHRIRSRFWIAMVAALSLAAAGCGKKEPAAMVASVDLAAEFAHATLGVETRAIEFGRPEARPFLASGWSPDQVDAKNGEPYVRSTAWTSGLWFYVIEPTDLQATIRCRALRSVSPAGVELAITLNGQPWRTLELKPKLREYRLKLPAARLRGGVNTLELSYRPLGDSPTRRRPVVHWYRLALGAAEARTETPTVDDESRVVFVPYGTEVTYLARLAEGSVLRTERLRFLGDAEIGGRLEILTTSDEDGTLEAAVIAPGQESADVPLAPDGERLTRLHLRASSRDPAPAGSGVALRAPAVWSPETPGVEASGGSRKSARPNVIVYMIDTLRADHLGCYGYDKPVSPRIDEFAAGATLFENAVGQSSWTRASIASVFTGLWPAAHGAVDRLDRLSGDAVTLAEAMRAEGYATAAVITNFNVHRSFGFDQGFEDFIHTNKLKTASDQVNAYGEAWLEKRDPDKPFLLYLHTVDPHNPYLPPERFRQRFAPGTDDLVRQIGENTRAETWDSSPETIQGLKALYDAEIAFNDESFGALEDHLRELGIWDDSIVVLLSDHGEEFYDHGRWSHGKDLHVETLNVPLIIKMPGQNRGARRSEVVQHIDIMPTLLEVLGVDLSAVVQGTSFLHLLDVRERGGDARPDAWSHLHLDGPLQVSLVTDRWKLIQRHGTRGGLQNLLYDWRADPRETRELSAQRPVTAAVLASLIERKLADPGLRLEGGEADLSPEVERQLKALGYLQ